MKNIYSVGAAYFALLTGLRSRLVYLAMLWTLVIPQGLTLAGAFQARSPSEAAAQEATLPNGDSSAMGISSNGLRIVFASEASNLVTNDHNAFVDIFVRDRSLNRTLLASVSTNEHSSGNGPSVAPVLSSNGGVVAFQSDASDLADNDYNGGTDIFARDVDQGKTWLVSVNWSGTNSGNGISSAPAVSADGNWIVFESQASDLVTNDTNNASDIFVRDLKRGATYLVSVNASGTASGNGASTNPNITPDGRYVVFRSRSGNLVRNVQNSGSEVFVRDLQACLTYWASTNAAQLLPGSDPTVAYSPALSGNGRFVAFKIANSNAVLVARHELETGYTLLISSNYVGNPLATTNIISFSDFSGPQISADGQLVVYTSVESGNYNATNQVFVWDGLSGTNRCVSLNLAGTGPGNQFSGNPVLSADARLVVFESAATDLVTNAVSGVRQIYARDMQTEQTTLISVNYQGVAFLKGDIGLPVVSANGQWVALDTTDYQMIPNFFSPYQNIYLRNLDTDITELVFDSHTQNDQEDTDQDGMSDQDELLAGTDPKDRNSVLRINAPVVSNEGMVTIYWSAVGGKSYRVQYTGQLEEAQWHDLPGDVRALSDTEFKVDATIPQEQKRYYRILLVH